jgi:biotin carboxyl carrier protein
MYEVKVNSDFQFMLNTANDDITLDNKDLVVDLSVVKDGQFHFIYQHKSYNAEIISENTSEKSMVIKVNGKLCRVQIKDQFDLLIKEMGLEAVAVKRAPEIKAPMPGLVLGLNVTVGQPVAKGDSLLVLEAMKMENLLKSSTDGIIKKICVAEGDKVEKNQVLIEFL